MAKQHGMRYCRVVFYDKMLKRQWHVDFGYVLADQRLPSIAKLREQYADHNFINCFQITEERYVSGV